MAVVTASKEKSFDLPGQTTFSTNQQNIQSKTIVLALSHGIDDKVVTGRLQFYRSRVLEYLISDPLRTFSSMIATKQATIKDGVCQRRWQKSNHSNPFLRIYSLFLSRRRSRPLRPLFLKARHWLFLVLVVVVIHFSICGVNFLEVDLLCDHSQR